MLNKILLVYVLKNSFQLKQLILWNC